MFSHLARPDRRTCEENLVTAANAITLLRTGISLILFSASVYLRDPMLNLAGLTVYWLGDVADGFLARRLDQETLFGAQWDILSDRLSVSFFYLNYLWFYPALAPSIALFLLQFTVLDHYLSNQYLRWPILSPNYFHRIDQSVWRLNWSKLGKMGNTGLVTVLLLATKSNVVVLPVVIVLIAIKLYSCWRVLRLREPMIRTRTPRPAKVTGEKPRLVAYAKGLHWTGRE